MNAALHAEFLKLRTTRTAAGLVGLALAVTALIAALESATAGTGGGMAIPSLATRAGLRDLLRQLAGEGRTVLVSSHLLAEVAQTADQVIVIDHGRLISCGPVSQLTAESGQAVMVRTPRTAELRAALDAEGVAVTELAADRLEITGAGPEQVATLAAALGVPIFEISEQAASLEDAFLRLTAAEGRPG